MTDFISATVGGLRGSGLSPSDVAALDKRVTAADGSASKAAGLAVMSAASATRAELARDAALLNGELFLTVAAGLAATPAGKRFAVAGAAGSATYATSWLNQAGVAVSPIAYPSLDAYASVRADTDVVRLASNVDEQTGVLLNEHRGLSLDKVGVVLQADASKPFMAGMVESPCIWWDPNTFKYQMVFTGYTTTNYPAAVASVGLASSVDLVNWTVDGGPLLIGSNTAGAPDRAGATGPVMVYEDGTYYLYYIGLTEVGYEAGSKTICLATATSLAGPWTRRGIVVDRGVAGSDTFWREGGVYHASVVKRSGIYYMFFNASGTVNGKVRERIGYATATSLLGPWAVDDANSPILDGIDGAWHDDVTGDPAVHRCGNLWVMDLFGASAGFVTASDGIAFTTDDLFPLGWQIYTDGPVLRPTPGGYDAGYAHKPFIYFHGGRKHHFYTASRTQANGVEFRGIALAVQADPARRRRLLGAGELARQTAVPDGQYAILERFNSLSGPEIDLIYDAAARVLKYQRNGVNGFGAAELLRLAATGAMLFGDLSALDLTPLGDLAARLESPINSVAVGGKNVYLKAGNRYDGGQDRFTATGRPAFQLAMLSEGGVNGIALLISTNNPVAGSQVAWRTIWLWRTSPDIAAQLGQNWTSDPNRPLKVRRELDRIFVSGSIFGGAITDGSLLLTLPNGCHPAAEERVILRSGDTGMAMARVDTLGRVYLMGAAPTGEITFPGVNFISLADSAA
ncbi:MULTISPECIES: hypothetical protein [Sphingomonas]|uniref:hypothetical protein n=1 Tax=Sphingomonas TaxID=13687 RepID=UPI00254ABB38|nr:MULTISPECIES: hypothetical protein [Sphingomonas]MDK8186733.1 hypothetical protein [Sphingomonas zeae]MDK8216397.1 hypothetical protein [Sphingomonas sp. UMB7805-LC452B]